MSCEVIKIVDHTILKDIFVEAGFEMSPGALEKLISFVHRHQFPMQGTTDYAAYGGTG